MTSVSSKEHVKMGHLFRGEYLDYCSQIEKWFVQTLQNKKVEALKSKDKKPPYLFGQRLCAINNLTGSNPELFKNPAKIGELLDEFAPYATMRADIGHSTLRIVSIEDEHYLLFENIGSKTVCDVPKRYLISLSESQPLLTRLKRIAKLISDQNLKDTP